MVRVYGARDTTEAQFVKELLETEAIPVVIQGGALQAVLGEVPLSRGSLPSIWVKLEVSNRAMTIISELNRGGPAAAGAGPSWTCPKCGEVREGQLKVAGTAAQNDPCSLLRNDGSIAGHAGRHVLHGRMS